MPIRSLEHFFASRSSDFLFSLQVASLLFGQSNAFRGEKQCFAPEKALLGAEIRFFGGKMKSVLKVGFLLARLRLFTF